MPDFNDSAAQEIVAAAQQLLAVCDGAHDKDDAGFNAPDAIQVRNIFKEYELDTLHLRDLWERLRKYKVQLAHFGIDVATLVEPPREAKAKVTLVEINVHESCKDIIFDFGKYTGSSLFDVASDKKGRNYLEWMVGADFREPWKTWAKAALAGNAVEPPKDEKGNVVKATTSKRVAIEHVSDDTYAVLFPKIFKDDFKDAVEGRIWNNAETRWEIPSLQIGKAVSFFEGRGLPVELDDHAKSSLKKERKRRQELDGIRELEDIEIEVPGLKLSLFGYQNVGVAFAKRAGFRVGITDSMGLGKSIEAIACILLNHAISPKYRALICCPGAVRINWAREVEKFTHLTYCIWDSKGPHGDLDATVHIINYDVMLEKYGNIKKFRAMQFDMLICDEAHKLSNKKSGRSQAVNSLVFSGKTLRIPHIVLLTGTPVLKSPSELFQLVHWIDMKRFPNWFSYANRYGAWAKGNLQGRPSTPRNLDELHERTKDIIIRRVQEEVQKDMPPLIVGEVFVELSDAEKREYHQLLIKLFDNARERKKISLPEMAEIQAWLNSKKLPRAHELIDEYVSGGHSVLLFSTRLAPLHETLAKYGEKAALIEGSMSFDKRQVSIDRLQSGDAVVGCLSLNAAGVGINLTAADRVLFLDMDWTPANHLQAQKRAHRTGQMNTVMVNYLVADGTADTILRAMHVEKSAVADEITDGKIVTSKGRVSIFGEFIRRLRKDARVSDFTMEIDDAA